MARPLGARQFVGLGSDDRSAHWLRFQPRPGIEIALEPGVARIHEQQHAPRPAFASKIGVGQAIEFQRRGIAAPCIAVTRQSTR